MSREIDRSTPVLNRMRPPIPGTLAFFTTYVKDSKHNYAALSNSLLNGVMIKEETYGVLSIDCE